MRTGFLLAAAAAMTLSMAAPATADEAADSPADRAYELSEPTTAGADQCDLPVAERSGNWLCLSGEQDQAAAHADAADAAATADTADTADTTDGIAEEARNTHCTGQACWTRHSALRSDFSSVGHFGYGPLRLGEVKVHFRTDLRRHHSASNPVTFVANTNVSNLTMSGERLAYTQADPAGTPVAAGATFRAHSTMTAQAGELVRWSPNGYRVTDATANTGGVVHQWSWTKPGFPGSWYVYGKSVKFDKAWFGYRYGAANNLPKDPVRYGWRLMP
ncbi:hypothetical protein HNR23_003616 [Nocardiopsis mwathae]|uniref:Uncharacterized protein n=1 Tax=Nocardiopsis mwathae TaxID=1472723 RepID=A0A7X0D7B5_9ACTN|nr:hypothetical protein [Nocardiopsis mwathae]MBB6173556.1 hypothetical protein [Nocardiopsis mwathae]